ncbi:hypothetical protein PV10_06681 [Exophiala mesophila]|uniref:Uncharacterized protein n=1 Tax=Exophiala mesophila TaxID=212818 RepID=A0A0D1ZZF1_EXOME|nr:uncharacterized protein PV10_06681 [Exophiala mesophila]KIV92223.1 hypothetical protein PV10_06681 [Exophiala mesophila]
MQNDIDQLQYELAVVKRKLASKEATTRTASQPVIQYNGIGQGNTMSSAEEDWRVSDQFQDDGNVSNESFCNMTIWIEHRNGQPHGLHVKQQQQHHHHNANSQLQYDPIAGPGRPVVKSATSGSQFNRSLAHPDGERSQLSACFDFTSVISSSTRNNQLQSSNHDLVIIAMEFVLKYAPPPSSSTSIESQIHHSFNGQGN